MNIKNVTFYPYLIVMFMTISCYLSARDQLTFPSSSFDQFSVQQSPLDQEDNKLLPQAVDNNNPSSFPSSAPQEEKKSKQKKEAHASATQKNIYLNFENTALTNFVNYMSELKKLNLIPDKSLNEAKVSLTIRDPLTVDGAWNVFLTVLEMAGFSIVKVGDVHKVIPKDQKLTQPLPSYINVPVETLPDSDITIRYVVFLQNLSVDAIRDLLKSMLSDKHEVIAQKEVNGLIITDKSYNIKSAVNLLKELDQTGQPETVVVMKLKRTNATDVKELLNALIKQPEGSPIARLLGQTKKETTEYFPPGTRIIAEERTNSLILLGAADSIKKIEDFIVNNVDTDLKAAESPLHIYELQYTDATQIASILREVTAAPESGPGQQAAKYGAIRGGVKFFKSMNFQVDKDGNRLIVSSTDKEDWALLKKTIEDLDKPQPQVAIESLFVSIDATDDKALGGMLRNKKHGQLGKHIDFQSVPLTGRTAVNQSNDQATSLLGDLFSQLISQQGATLLTFGKAANIWAVFQAFKEEKNTSILSQPFLTVTNKTTARIEVGEELQVVQEEGSEGRRGFGTVTAKTSVEIEPQINLDGIIRMQISIDIGDFLDASTGDKENKQLKTNVTMADGQVLVLGGFVKTKVEETKNKTPLLGDIPVLGWLFKNQKRTIRKNYIFIFISPTIIKPRQLPGIGLYTKMKMHQATDQIEGGILTTKSRDPLFNWFFDPKKENYSHKVVDFANARYQPTTVDIKNDSYYRVHTQHKEAQAIAQEESEETSFDNSNLQAPSQTSSPSTAKDVPSPIKQSLPQKRSEKVLPFLKNSDSVTSPHQAKLKQDPVASSFPRSSSSQEPRFVAKNQTSQSPEDHTPSALQELARKPILNSLTRKKSSAIADQELEERRKRLKEIIKSNAPLSQMPPTTSPKNELKDFIATNPKTKSLKEFLTPSSPKTSTSKKGTSLNINQAKRKNLKKLFSQNHEESSSASDGEGTL